MDAGKVIKKLRKENGLTQQQLAELLQISKASVQKYEQGDVQNIKLETLRKICEQLNAPPYLLIFPESAEEITGRLSDAYNLKQMRSVWRRFTQLNGEGAGKAAGYIRDLYALEKYRKED